MDEVLLAIAISTFLVLLGVLLVRSEIEDSRHEMNSRFREFRGEIQSICTETNSRPTEVRSGMNSRFGEVTARLNRSKAELRQFFREVAMHDSEIELRKGRK